MCFATFYLRKGFAWTLVESFSFENNDLIEAAGFSKDKSLNENNHNWVKYRFSHAHMKQIANKSTYFRATC